MKKVLTTGQMAKHAADVAPRTVSKWFDSGKLQGYRIPDSQDRRIPLEKAYQFLIENKMPTDTLTEFMLDPEGGKATASELAAFLTEHGLLLPDGLSDAAKFQILTIGMEGRLRDLLKIESDQVAVTHVNCMFGAGSYVTKKTPNVIVLDCVMGTGDCRNAIQTLRGQEKLSGVIIVMLAAEDQIGDMDGADLTIKRPFAMDALSHRLKLFVESEAA